MSVIANAIFHKPLSVAFAEKFGSLSSKVEYVTSNFFDSRSSKIEYIDRTIEWFDEWEGFEDTSGSDGNDGRWNKLAVKMEKIYEERLAYALEDGDIAVMKSMFQKGFKIKDIYLLVCGFLNGHKDILVPWVEEHLLDQNLIDENYKDTSEFYEVVAEQAACQLNIVGLDSALEQEVKPTLEELEYGITENDLELTTRADVAPVRSWVERNMHGLDDQQEKRGWPVLYACPKAKGVPPSSDDLIFSSDEQYESVLEKLYE